MNAGHALLCRHGGHHYIRQMWYDGPPHLYTHMGRLVWRCSLCGHRVEGDKAPVDRATWHKHLCRVGLHAMRIRLVNADIGVVMSACAVCDKLDREFYK